ncbi:MAG: riboflavin synthase [Planctomycetes bacterium]|nr:riboflavin synthase [Planctomycetota bacterium]
MFTGIVTQRARVAEVAPSPSGAAGVVRITVELERAVPGTVVGDSLALDGCCLTVVALDGARVAFEAIPETLRKTTLSRRRAGDRVNLEAALKVGDALGGHLVQGHVDGVGVLREVARRGDDVRMVIGLPDTLRGATVPKGSVAVDGVSLTVGECAEDWFSVYLIPHTLDVTGLAEKRTGDPVNLEADVVGRYVEHHVRRWMSGLASKGAVPQEGTR